MTVFETAIGPMLLESLVVLFTDTPDSGRIFTIRYLALRHVVSPSLRAKRYHMLFTPGKRYFLRKIENSPLRRLVVYSQCIFNDQHSFQGITRLGRLVGFDRAKSGQ